MIEVTLLFVIAALLAYQVLQQASVRTLGPNAPSDLSRAHHDTTTLLLLAPNGETEFEVSWHRGEIPQDYRLGEVYYQRKSRRTDGSVEFQR